MTERLISNRHVMEKLGMKSQSTLNRFRGLRGFPKPLEIPGHPKWREADLDEWIRKQARKANA